MGICTLTTEKASREHYRAAHRDRSFNYGRAGQRTRTDYRIAEQVSYDHGPAGRLVGVSDWGGGEHGYSYDAAGRLLQARQPNGVQSDYRYDAAGRLVGIEHSDWQEWLAGLEYTLDPAGNRVAVTETTSALLAYHLPALGETAHGPPAPPLEPPAEGALAGQVEVIQYGYDANDRLTSAVYQGGDRYEYAYDPVGNRTALTTTAGTTAYVYDDADRLTAVDGVPVTYDQRGNLTSDGTWTFTYNGAGRMVRAESISATQVYTYNGDGLLVAQSLDGVETAFTWDQALAIPQVLATSDSMRSVYGLGRLAVEQGGQWYYPQGDALGSVRQWADALAAVLAVQSYSPYGEPISGLEVAPWGFTGEWHDPSGVVYLRARWYNASLGRFLQVDPFPGVLMAPATRHAYAYVLGDPVGLTDPTGEVAPLLVALGLGAGIGAVSGAIEYVRAHPGESLQGYIHDQRFWTTVGIGAASGAASGLVGYLLPVLLPAAHSMAWAVAIGAITGAASSATFKSVENLLTGCTPWHTGVIEAALTGGIAGGLTGGIGYGVRAIFGKADITVRKLRRGVSIRSDQGRVEIHVIDAPEAKVPDWLRGKLLPHYHRRPGIKWHRPWESRVRSFWHRF